MFNINLYISRLSTIVCCTLAMAVVSPAQAAESVTARENLQTLIKTGSCVGCNLSEINFTRMDLAGADLSGADLSLCKFSLANLSGANLSGAKLNGATFGGADLGGADLSGADLRGVVFDGAYLNGTKMDGEFVTTKPYENIGIDDIEKKVYVKNQGEPKRSPATTDVKIKKRRDFEASPPAVTKAPSGSVKKVPTINAVAAPAAKTVAQIQGVSVPVTAVDVTESKTIPAAPEVQTNIPASKKSTPVIAEVTLPEEQEKAALQDKPAVISEDEEVRQAAEDAEPVHNKQILQLLDTDRCYGCDLTGADLSKKNLNKVDLELANLAGANLTATDLRKANLKGANLSGAKLNGADLRGADLYKANLSGADLTDARTSEALLDNTNLDGAVGLPEAASKSAD